MITKKPIPIEIIVGEQLSSIEFVQDYLQLRFDGPTLTTFVWPSLKFCDRTLRFGELTYRDELCGRIGRIVSNASLRAGEALTVRFDDGVEISVSLKAVDRVGPEAGNFRESGDSQAPLLDF
jgi:hypothetical protein